MLPHDFLGTQSSSRDLGAQQLRTEGTNGCSGSQRCCPMGSGVPPWWAAPQGLTVGARTPAGPGLCCSAPRRACAPFTGSHSGLGSLFPKKPCDFGRVLQGSLLFHRPKAPIRDQPQRGRCRAPEGPVPSTLPSVGQTRKRGPRPQAEAVGPAQGCGAWTLPQADLVGTGLPRRQGRGRAPDMVPGLWATV